MGMRGTTIALLCAATCALAGCDKRDGGKSGAEAPARGRAGNFVAFDAASVTNIPLARTASIKLDYAALDGKGELQRILEPGDISTVEEALAYIGRTCARADENAAKTIVKLYLDETRVGGIGAENAFAVWEVAPELYLVVESAKEAAQEILMCDFVLCDGAVLRRLAPFEALPASDAIWECMRACRKNPAALNNIAAMLFNGVAMRSAVSAEHINFLLLMAAGAGEPVACRNLAKFYASSLSEDADRDYKRDFWLRRTREAVMEKNAGFAPALEPRTLEDWPR